MSMFEIEHPIAQELTTITAAFDDGLAGSELMPSEMSATYLSPLETNDGIAKISFVDAETENVGAIFIPVFCSSESASQLSVMDQDGIRPTIARIKLVDIKQRDFPISIGDKEVPSEHIQFDVIEDGIIFSAAPNGHQISSYGIFETALYYSWTKMAERQASLNKLHAAALMHLSS